MLICAQLLVKLSSLGVLSTVILGPTPAATPPVLAAAIRPSRERDRTPIPTGDGERDRRRPEKLDPLWKMSFVSLSLSFVFIDCTVLQI